MRLCGFTVSRWSEAQVRVGRRPSGRLCRALSFFLLWTACGACAAPELARPLRVQVGDDIGNALAGVAVRRDGLELARTAESGAALLAMPATQNGRVEIAVDCPGGFRPAAPRSVRAQHQSLRTLHFVCRPLERQVLLAMRLPGAEGLPLHVDGQRVATVGANGSAHLRLLRPPESQVRVVVDTAERPRLLPAMPEHTFFVRDRDELFVIDQSFAIATPTRGLRRPQSGRSGSRPPRPPRAPRRLRRL